MKQYRDRVGEVLHGVSENRFTEIGVNSAVVGSGTTILSAGALSIPFYGATPGLVATGAGAVLTGVGAYRLGNNVGVTKMLGLHPDN